LLTFAFSVYTGASEKKDVQNTPIFRVVLSSSMSEKNKKNQYLFDNELDDQFQQFDLILTRKLPKEQDLQLYDIVVYEIEDTLVVHRIVGIEEPNEKHPNERRFILQGDAVASPDGAAVSYAQMKGIYQGDRIPFVGSFVLFMQSPAGYMCVILIILGVIGISLMERKLEKEKLRRLHFLFPCVIDGEGNLLNAVIDTSLQEPPREMQDYYCEWR
jgi:signal peptidase I